MSAAFLVFAILSLSIFSLLVWLIFKPLPEEATLSRDTKIEDLFPLHTQHFPQLRQALESTDSRYVRQKAAPSLRREWRQDRRRILQGFLEGLAEDFAKLDRLARIVASLSPRLSRREELARIWLAFGFRLNYRIVSVWILIGGANPLDRLNRLTALLGELSSRAEAAMARLQARPT